MSDFSFIPEAYRARVRSVLQGRVDEYTRRLVDSNDEQMRGRIKELMALLDELSAAAFDNENTP